MLSMHKPTTYFENMTCSWCYVRSYDDLKAVRSNLFHVIPFPTDFLLSWLWVSEVSSRAKRWELIQDRWEHLSALHFGAKAFWCSLPQQIEPQKQGCVRICIWCYWNHAFGGMNHRSVLSVFVARNIHCRAKITRVEQREFAMSQTCHVLVETVYRGERTKAWKNNKSYSGCNKVLLFANLGDI